MKKLKDLYESAVFHIENIWYDWVRSPIKRGVHLIKCIYLYSRYVFWDDADWDYSYLLKLMRFKISRMRKTIGSNQIIVHAEKYCKQMRVAEIIIDRILESDYCADRLQEHYKKWKLFEGDFVSSFRRTHLSQEQKEQESKEFRVLLDAAHKQEEKDWNFLFEHLRKRMRRWWD